MATYALVRPHGIQMEPVGQQPTYETNGGMPIPYTGTMYMLSTRGSRVKFTVIGIGIGKERSGYYHTILIEDRIATHVRCQTVTCQSFD
jgi:hypothetical protein